MKPGDRAIIKGVFIECTVHTVGPDGIHVWWPCPEFGLHERLVGPEFLESMTGPGHGQMPKRIKDHPRGPKYNLQKMGHSQLPPGPFDDQ